MLRASTPPSSHQKEGLIETESFNGAQNGTESKTSFQHPPSTQVHKLSWCIKNYVYITFTLVASSVSFLSITSLHWYSLSITWLHCFAWLHWEYCRGAHLHLPQKKQSGNLSHHKVDFGTIKLHMPSRFEQIGVKFPGWWLCNLYFPLTFLRLFRWFWNDSTNPYATGRSWISPWDQ